MSNVAEASLEAIRLKVTEALEVCRTLDDVESFLKENHRDGGMMLFAVDGKTDEFAIFECLCASHFRRDPSEGWLVGTNHFVACEDRTLGQDEGSISTLSRLRRLSDLLGDLRGAPEAARLPDDLVRILADDEIAEACQVPVVVLSTGPEICHTFSCWLS